MPSLKCQKRGLPCRFASQLLLLAVARPRLTSSNKFRNARMRHARFKTRSCPVMPYPGTAPSTGLHTSPFLPIRSGISLFLKTMWQVTCSAFAANPENVLCTPFRGICGLENRLWSNFACRKYKKTGPQEKNLDWRLKHIVLRMSRAFYPKLSRFCDHICDQCIQQIKLVTNYD